MFINIRKILFSLPAMPPELCRQLQDLILNRHSIILSADILLKIAGTEIGLGIEPQITFSACFGAPFMVRHPYEYSQMLKERMLEA